MAELDFGNECCICCKACSACLNHAVCRKVKQFLNTLMPGLCPVRDTERIWASDGRRKPAGLRAYVLREHSITSVFFAPSTRPTDLHKCQLVATILMGVAVALYMSMIFAETYPDEIGTVWQWLAILAISVVASLAKACYKSGLKRTYFCALHLRNVKVHGVEASVGTFLFKKPAKELELHLRLGGAEVQAAVTRSSETAPWKVDATEDLRLALRYETLELQVRQPPQNAKEKPTVIGSAEQEISELKGLEVGGTIPLSMALGKKGSKGTVAFSLSLERDEPITALGIVLALARPLTSCVVLQCCVLLTCLPCIFLYNCSRHNMTRAGQRGPRTSKPGAGKSRSRSGWSGQSWRHILRTVVGLAFLAAACRIGALLLLGGAWQRKNLEGAAELFIKAKLFGWFVTEPGSLLWTYFTMWSCCPALLPRHSHEEPAAPAVPELEGGSQRLDRPLMEPAGPRKQRASPSPRKQQGCTLQ